MLKSYLNYSKLARDIKITTSWIYMGCFGLLGAPTLQSGAISVYRYLEGGTCSKWVETSFYQHWLLKWLMTLQFYINEVSFAVYFWDDNELLYLSY